jgi:hypothetical protein
MFTFGRDRELEHVRERHGARATVPLLLRLVDSVHDYLERTASRQDVERTIERALVEGESGIWETAGTWLLKLNRDAPESQDLWRMLAAHPHATVRFRIASFLDDVEVELARELYERFSADRSERVRDHAFGKCDFRMHPERYGAPARGGGT